MEAQEQKDKKIEENERVAEGRNVWEEIGLEDILSKTVWSSMVSPFHVTTVHSVSSVSQSFHLTEPYRVPC